MELVFLRQMIQMIENTELDVSSYVFLPETGEGEEIVGVVENDDIKKLIILRERLKEEVWERGRQDALLYIKDIDTAMENLAKLEDPGNLAEIDVEELERMVRAQIVRRNQHELRKLRYQIVEKILAYAVLTVFPEVHDLNAIYFRRGWKVAKKIT